MSDTNCIYPSSSDSEDENEPAHHASDGISQNILTELDPDNHFFKIVNNCKYYQDDCLIQLFKEQDSNKSISLIHFNSRSLTANLQNIKEYLSQLNIEFDIIAISETW